MKINEWQYNDLQQVGVDYESIEEVQKYDNHMQKLRDIKKEVDVLVSATNPTANSSVLEIGTGTGEFAIAISKYSKNICAIDISAVMLEYAQKKAEEKEIKNIEFYKVGFLTYSKKEEKYDIIFTQLALHHLPDFWKSIALSKIFNLLKEGGRFFLKDVVFPSGVKDYENFFDAIITGIEQSSGKEYSKEIKQHIKSEYSTLDWIMEGLLKKAGFKILESRIESGFIATYVCTK